MTNCESETPRGTFGLVGEPPSRNDLLYLEASWLTPEIIDQASIRRVDDSTGRSVVGRNGSGGNYNGFVFPYFLPGEDRIREYRLRRDKPDLEYKNGQPKQKSKYLAPPGRANLAYFSPGTTLDALADTNLPLAIVEGEKKCLAILRLATWESEKPRWLPVGIPGVWNWRGTVGKTTGPDGDRCDVKGPISDLDRISWSGRRVFIIFDSDVATNESVKAARRLLADELRSRGSIVLLVTVPAPDGAKVGIDDLLASDGPEKALALFDGATPSGDPDLLRQPFTDAGNAQRLLALYGHQLRYVAETKSWAIYSGKRWARDSTSTVTRLAIDTMRATYRQAAHLEDEDQRKVAEKHARKSEQARTLRDMVALAPASAGITVSATGVDRQPLLLNFTNGTLNLETGQLYDHRRSDQLSKLCPHPYELTAECPEFLRFLYAAMGDVEDSSDAQRESAHTRVEFLQKAIGASLTADVTEKVIFCLFGPCCVPKLDRGLACWQQVAVAEQ